LANRRVSGDSNKIRQSPIRILDVDDEAVGQFGDGIFIRSITERAGLAWRAAAARMRTVPLPIAMGLAAPAAVVAAWAKAHRASKATVASTNNYVGLTSKSGVEADMPISTRWAKKRLHQFAGAV
jgi:hypothetical protein